MSFGKLYTGPGNPRSVAIKAIAKANNIDLEIVTENPAEGVSADYLKINKLGKIPTFVGADGFTLSECIAIAVYSMSTLHHLEISAPCVFGNRLHVAPIAQWQESRIQRS